MIPRIAIIDSNTLEATGLRNILADIAPMADVSTFGSVEEMAKEFDEMAPFVHFFVSSQVLVTNAEFFLQRQRQTIVLTAQPITGPQFSHFRTLNTNQMEHGLLKEILTMFQHVHGNHAGHGHPSDAPAPRPMPTPTATQDLSPREIEVLTLVVRGHINKEIADRLCISLPTVVTHRKNICDKLHLRSVSALTIYAVTHGLVSAEEI